VASASVRVRVSAPRSTRGCCAHSKIRESSIGEYLVAFFSSVSTTRFCVSAFLHSATADGEGRHASLVTAAIRDSLGLPIDHPGRRIPILRGRCSEHDLNRRPSMMSTLRERLSWKPDLSFYECSLYGLVCLSFGNNRKGKLDRVQSLTVDFFAESEF
jgi:hypothetical protein